MNDDQKPDKGDQSAPWVVRSTVSTNGGDVYREVPTSAIDKITVVRIYDETLPHLAEHRELSNLIPSLEHAIDDTIANPVRVVQSNTDIHVGGYKFCSNNHTSGGNNQLVVAVKVVEGSSALLKTAYFTETVRGTVVFGPDHD